LRKRCCRAFVAALLVLGGLPATAAAQQHRFGHQHHHRHHGVVRNVIIVGPSPALYAPPPQVVYYPQPVVYYYPPPAYYAPPAQTYAPPPAPTAPPVSQDAQPIQREVVFASGRWVLQGDGVSVPYRWVWIPNPPTAPPPGAASAEPERPIYAWTDPNGVTTYTDRLSKVPPEHRATARREP
jgi:hypothetical protein